MEGAVVDKAHNEFLQVAATTGLLGLAAYIWVFVSYFRHSYRSGGWELLALSGGVLAYILQLQTAFTTIATGVTFWAILGVSVAVMRLRNNSKDDRGAFYLPASLPAFEAIPPSRPARVPRACTLTNGVPAATRPPNS